MLSLLLILALTLFPIKTVYASLELIDFTEKVATEGAGYESSAGDLQVVITNIINTFLTLLGAIFLILIIYGGFKWMTAGGEAENIKKAQGTIRNAVIGLVIVLLAWAITLFVVDKIGGATVGGLQVELNPV